MIFHYKLLFRCVDMCFIITAVLLSALTYAAYWINKKRTWKLPPGPYGLPFVGYSPFLSSKPYLDLQKLAKQYGPIFRLRIGEQNVIVLSDYETIKNAFAQDTLMGRPIVQPFDNSKETIETNAFNGLPFKEQRRFSLHILKTLGLGKSRIEDPIKAEIQDLLEHFAKYEGKPFHLKNYLASSVSNNITTLMYGTRLKHEDPTRVMLNETLSVGAGTAKQMGIYLFYPTLVKCLRFLGLGSSKLEEAQQKFKQYTRKQVEEHEKTLTENNIRDYIDGYLLEIKKRQDKTFCKPVLVDMVSVFFAAGSETTRVTLEWLMLTMAAYKNVQDKIYAEIDNVIGREGSPTWMDHSGMPYTEATIMEILRWRTIIPINILRSALWNTYVTSGNNGYFVPKDYFIIANLWDIHHNPEYWGDDAEDFRPERFLTDDGKEVKIPEYFIPFSIGKRQCPGESFAKREIFLYFVSILQKFQIELAPGNSPDFEGQLEISYLPKPQQLCLIKRI